MAAVAGLVASIEKQLTGNFDRKVLHQRELVNFQKCRAVMRDDLCRDSFAELRHFVRLSQFEWFLAEVEVDIGGCMVFLFGGDTLTPPARPPFWIMGGGPKNKQPHKNPLFFRPPQHRQQTPAGLWATLLW